MIKFFWLSLWLVLALVPQALWAQSRPAAEAIQVPRRFVHPGMLQSRRDLDYMKQQVLARQQPWLQAFEKLKEGAPLSFEPQPFTHVIRGSYGRPSIGARELSASAHAAYSHALLWYITGDKAHAQKAIQILNAWSGVLWDFDENDAKLLAGWTGHDFCNAAEILRYTDSGWAEKDIAQFKGMLLTVYYPLIRDFFPEANGNWDAALVNTLLCIGIFCDDRQIFEQAVNHYLRGPGNAGLTRYIYPSGQCQESTRDQPHVQLGLGEMAQACQVAWTQGLDLYGAAQNRLALGFEYTARYMLGEQVPVYGRISPKGRGDFRDIYESVYQHFRQFKDLDLPYTGRAAALARPASGLKLLTAFRAPVSGKGKAAALKNDLVSFPSLAGALSQATAEPPADVLFVQPGQSIQAALDAKAHTGGWVVLAKGLHTLPATLLVPSGITLAGQGLETILFLDPALPNEKGGAAIINAAYDLHDVTLRDFVVEGATSPETSSDPNQDRRKRSYQVAPVRSGILLSALQESQMRNIRLEHVTVRNCTRNGVAIRGASQVLIRACDFSDNGGSVVPGAGMQHNLLLTRLSDVQVLDSRLAASPWGSGLDLSHSAGVSIRNNELARNARHGIRVSESRQVRIAGNLVEGNDRSGILLDALLRGSRQVWVEQNRSHYNGQYGLEIEQGTEAVLDHNILTGNKPGKQLYR